MYCRDDLFFLWGFLLRSPVQGIHVYSLFGFLRPGTRGLFGDRPVLQAASVFPRNNVRSEFFHFFPATTPSLPGWLLTFALPRSIATFLQTSSARVSSRRACAAIIRERKNKEIRHPGTEGCQDTPWTRSSACWRENDRALLEVVLLQVNYFLGAHCECINREHIYYWLNLIYNYRSIIKSKMKLWRSF